MLLGDVCVVASFPLADARVESRLCVCLGSVCIAISCLIQSDPLAGLFGATAFTLVSIYAAIFHTTRWLAVTWVAAGVTLAVLAVRLAAMDWAFAISSVLLVAFIVMFVSLTGKGAIWLVDADILHENFETLTGMFNRDGFYEKATTLLASRSRGDDRYLAVAVINLDSFSLVGEFSGQSGANRARVEIAARLRETARRDAVLAHISDSEFVIGDLFESADASALIERVRGTISGAPSRLSASVGVVTTPLQPLVQLPPHDVLGRAAGRRHQCDVRVAQRGRQPGHLRPQSSADGPRRSGQRRVARHGGTGLAIPGQERPVITSTKSL